MLIVLQKYLNPMKITYLITCLFDVVTMRHSLLNCICNKNIENLKNKYFHRIFKLLLLVSTIILFAS